MNPPRKNVLVLCDYCEAPAVRCRSRGARWERWFSCKRAICHFLALHHTPPTQAPRSRFEEMDLDAEVMPMMRWALKKLPQDDAPYERGDMLERMRTVYFTPDPYEGTAYPIAIRMRDYDGKVTLTPLADWVTGLSEPQRSCVQIIVEDLRDDQDFDRLLDSVGPHASQGPEHLDVSQLLAAWTRNR